MREKEYILNEVGKALDIQFELYSWENMIDDLSLTPEEKVWAKEHICYRAYLLN